MVVGLIIGGIVAAIVGGIAAKGWGDAQVSASKERNDWLPYVIVIIAIIIAIVALLIWRF